jgi:DNA-binding GntR family transcriptional regulator
MLHSRSNGVGASVPAPAKRDDRVTSGKLRRQAYSHIHRKILSGELPAGHQVSELSLAKEIGMSRTPVREAVQQLRREGLVEQRARFGTIVRMPQRGDLVELFELREALEPFAAGLAARRSQASDFPTLGKLCAEMDRIGEELQGAGITELDSERLERFLTADMAFHVRLLRAAGNHRIMSIVADSRVLIRIFSTRRQEHNLAVLKETYQFHSQILQAVMSGEVQMATELMARHIQASKRETLDYYDRVSSASGPGRTYGLPEHMVDEFDRLTRELEVEDWGQ